MIDGQETDHCDDEELQGTVAELSGGYLFTSYLKDEAGRRRRVSVNTGLTLANLHAARSWTEEDDDERGGVSWEDVRSMWFSTAPSVVSIEREGKLIGFATFTVYDGIHMLVGERPELSIIWVVPRPSPEVGERLEGVSELLLRAAIRVAEELGVRSYTFRAIDHEVELAASLGFREEFGPFRCWVMPRSRARRLAERNPSRRTAKPNLGRIAVQL